MMEFNFNKVEMKRAAELWLVYAKSKQALMDAKLIRSFKAAETDFAEWLVSLILGGQIVEDKCNPGYDVIAGSKRIQVKSLNKASDNRNGYLIHKVKDRKNDATIGATHYVFVFFKEHMPDIAFLVHEEFVRNFEGEQIKRQHLDRVESERFDLSEYFNSNLF